jgi:hypothetical protein
MTTEFDQERAAVLKRIAESVRDLAKLYARFPDRAIPSVDEMDGSFTVRGLSNEVGSEELHNVYPMSCQHASADGDEDTVWGPVVYCILGLSKDGLPLH